MPLTLYVAGPMTGLPDFNYPAFHAAARLLREHGYEVENPADNSSCGSWAGYLRAGLTQVLRCDGIALLDGWEGSRGARLEVHVADSLGMPIQAVTSWRHDALTGRTHPLLVVETPGVGAGAPAGQGQLPIPAG